MMNHARILASMMNQGGRESVRAWLYVGTDTGVYDEPGREGTRRWLVPGGASGPIERPWPQERQKPKPNKQQAASHSASPRRGPFHMRWACSELGAGSWELGICRCGYSMPVSSTSTKTTQRDIGKYWVLVYWHWHWETKNSHTFCLPPPQPLFFEKMRSPKGAGARTHPPSPLHVTGMRHSGGELRGAGRVPRGGFDAGQGIGRCGYGRARWPAGGGGGRCLFARAYCIPTKQTPLDTPPPPPDKCLHS
jgi:hypothetical protein